MLTAISTKHPHTTLTITTSEVLRLEQMGLGGGALASHALNEGTTKLTLGAGVFRILSNAAVKVGSDRDETVVLSNSTKDSGWPDPGKLRVEPSEDLRRFFDVAKDEPAPT